MIDRENVIEHLKEIAEYFRECRSNASFASKAENHFWELQNAASEAAELLKAQEPGWISVKDRLPEEYGNYIAVVDGKATECTYSGPLIKGIITGWSTCESDGMKWLRDEQVTHWMPLPEPPKEG